MGGLTRRFPRDGEGTSFEACRSSGLKVADAAIVSGYSVVDHLVVIPDGADCEVLVYDHATAASGTVVAAAVCKSTDPVGGHAGIYCEAVNGLYLKIVSGTPRVLVHYRN